MMWVKTERGRALLSDRRALSPRERQLMVLANGRRSTAELGRWLGFSVEPVLNQLVLNGYLERARGNLTPADILAETSSVRDVPAGPSTAVPLAAVAAPTELGFAASASRDNSRRSLAASKMYVVSLMQMLRDAEAASLAVSLHCAQAPLELVQVLAASLAYMHQRSGPDYAARVAARLLEVMPQAHLTALCDAFAATGAPALKAAAQDQRATQARALVPPTATGRGLHPPALAAL